MALCCCLPAAYFILTRVLIASHGNESALAKAVGRDLKGLASLGCYAVAIPLAFANPLFAGAVCSRSGDVANPRSAD